MYFFFFFSTFSKLLSIISWIVPHLTVQCLVSLSLHKLRCVPHEAANTPQPIQVLLVLDLKRDIQSDLICIFHHSICLSKLHLECNSSVLTLLMLSLTILLKKNSGRSGMDFHVPRELIYFSLYLT